MPLVGDPCWRPNSELHNTSNIEGITKWSVDGEACFNYWAKINSDCSVCIRVCPYTRQRSPLAQKVWARLAGGRGRRLALWWDRRDGGGQRVSSQDWWPSTGETSAGETGAVRVALSAKPD